MSNLLYLFCIIICLIQIQRNRAQIISPNITNGSTEYYIADTFGIFANQQIICNQSICHIECNFNSSCTNISIIATLSQRLSLFCRYSNSCKQIKIIDGPQSIADIQCLADNACSFGDINLQNVYNVHIVCNNNGLTTDNSLECFCFPAFDVNVYILAH